MTIFDELNLAYDKIFSAEYLDFLVHIEEKLIPLRDTNITSRNFNHWKNEGLVVNINSDQKRKWEKLTFIEFIWLNCIQELRNLDISIENIKRIREYLFLDFDLGFFKQIVVDAKRELVKIKKMDRWISSIQNLKIDESEKAEIIAALNNDMIDVDNDIKSTINLMYILTGLAITNQKEVGFLLYSDGSVTAFIEDMLNEPEFNKVIFFKAHVYISIKKQFYDFLTDENKQKYHNSLSLLTESESEIMEFIRDKSWTFVKIEKKENSTFITAETKVPYNPDEYQSWKKEVLIKYPFCKIAESHNEGKKNSILLTVTKKFIK